jgi:hypothetical protein
MGKLTISMAMFNSYVTNYQRVSPNSYYRTNIFLNMAIYSEFAMFNSYDCPEASVEKPLPLKQIWEEHHPCSIMFHPFSSTNEVMLRPATRPGKR